LNSVSQTTDTEYGSLLSQGRRRCHCLRQTRSVCTRKRSDEAIHLRSGDAEPWIGSVEPVIGRAFARPVGSQWHQLQHRPACGERSETERSGGSGWGDHPQVRACRESPSPARKMLATSPRKRGEVS